MNDQADGTAAQRQVRATFSSSDQMQDAISKLSMSGFDRADLSLPSPGLIQGTETPEAGAKMAATDTDAQQVRTLGASTAATVAAMAAAGTVASLRKYRLAPLVCPKVFLARWFGPSIQVPYMNQSVQYFAAGNGYVQHQGVSSVKS